VSGAAKFMKTQKQPGDIAAGPPSAARPFPDAASSERPPPD